MPKFTVITASEMGKRSFAIRKQREIERLLNPPKPVEPPLPNEEQSYSSRRLNRVRLQLDLIDTRIEAEGRKKRCDGQLLNWLCSAQERLSEQEQKLSMRPNPGTLRPAAPAKAQRTTQGPSLPPAA